MFFSNYYLCASPPVRAVSGDIICSVCAYVHTSVHPSCSFGRDILNGLYRKREFFSNLAHTSTWIFLKEEVHYFSFCTFSFIVRIFTIIYNVLQHYYDEPCSHKHWSSVLTSPPKQRRCIGN